MLEKIAVALLVLLIILLMGFQPGAVAQTGRFKDYPEYKDNDLGMVWTPQRTTFKLWAPGATAVKLHLYAQGEGGPPEQTLELKKGRKGVWSVEINGDFKGKYYTVQTQHQGQWLEETPDPYARAVGVNGRRGQIIDLAATNPEGWAQDQRPPLAHPTDIVLYELHVRDFSIHPASGIQHKGKYLAFTERGTRSALGAVTGIDHLRELGVTHVHLLPVFDFRSIDERDNPPTRYNWGYDPENYNAPEGSYATDPYDGAARIREFKQMVQALHAAGIRVVMDVVYNHTGVTDQSVFNRVEPGYYYRQNEQGGFSNASACGNETASERPMMRRYMVESLKYWAQEYHIDGFRFDLMGIHDIETMNLISSELHKIEPTIFLYGEGWTAGASPLPEAQRALKANTPQLDRVAAFSDDYRDAVKGHVFKPEEPGFISGKSGLKESVKFGIVASTQHPQVDYTQINYSKAPWAPEPYQTISYAECHDNHCLWDRLRLSAADASETDRIRMHKLAGVMVLTAQGVPFLHAGVEFLRSKNGVENSFESPDEVNWMDWTLKTRHSDVMRYYQQIIQLRKNHPAFRLQTAEQIRRHLEFLDTKDDNLVAYRLKDNAGGDAWSEILVCYNGSREAQTIELPAGNWRVVLDDRQMNEQGIGPTQTGSLSVPAIGALVLRRE